jgi:hypothetical protein
MIGLITVLFLARFKICPYMNIEKRMTAAAKIALEEGFTRRKKKMEKISPIPNARIKEGQIVLSEVCPRLAAARNKTKKGPMRNRKNGKVINLFHQ